jgi:RimJ/RimL family protein N-acetyltransferase
VRIELDGLTLRSWEPRDAEALARYADDRDVWLNLRDRFPHPYGHDDAVRWIGVCASEPLRSSQLAIDVGGEAVGAVGFDRLDDVHRLTAEIGYWLGRPFWGRGLATAALRAATVHAVDAFGFERLHAAVFEWNPASARVLEKAGYACEGRLRRYVVKAGLVGDALLYARLRGDPHS